MGGHSCRRRGAAVPKMEVIEGFPRRRARDSGGCDLRIATPARASALRSRARSHCLASAN